MRISKSRLLAIIISILVIIGGLGLYAYWSYVNSFQNVTVDNPRNASISLYQVFEADDGHDHDESEHHEINTFKDVTNRIDLRPGEYCLKSTDTKYSAEDVCFEVKDKAVSVSINPSLSSDYLDSLLTDDLKQQLETIVATKYAPLMNGYVLKSGALFNEGEWYGATLTTIIEPNDRGDVYRVLLHNESNEWKIVGYPQLYLNKYDYPNVPVSVLEATNKLVGSY